MKYLLNFQLLPMIRKVQPVNQQYRVMVWMIIIIVKREFDCLENEITVEDDNDEQDENFFTEK